MRTLSNSPHRDALSPKPTYTWRITKNYLIEKGVGLLQLLLIAEGVDIKLLPLQCDLGKIYPKFTRWSFTLRDFCVGGHVVCTAACRFTIMVFAFVVAAVAALAAGLFLVAGSVSAGFGSAGSSFAPLADSNHFKTFAPFRCATWMDFHFPATW